MRASRDEAGFTSGNACAALLKQDLTMDDTSRGIAPGLAQRTGR
ncbi:hypothetical protein K788_0000694 [Paraburkholderia caribensis MBA4]|uniref:Uncharacterized protein n=1 Tax=Paraburkholderia caribensis MBA4 TaxID=1323664 RepID=A0A0P0RHQ4_9BURK|nr:hypothetical protein K788_0000694 [Paraburkholderia caribensis MBA4]